MLSIRNTYMLLQDNNMLTCNLLDDTAVLSGFGHLDISRSCNCGQAFRWKKASDGKTYCGVIGDKRITVSSDDNSTLTLYPCTENDIATYIDYFDLRRDYSEIEEFIRADEVLSPCSNYADGIRIFNQNPFETVISFIISANNNIKRISGIIERLCDGYGEAHYDDLGAYHSFPTPEILAAMPVESLIDIGAGYRAPYIKSTAIAISNGFSLDELVNMPYRDAKKRLCTLMGVGEKVADCVLLFSLRHTCAFPMDVWMKRAVCEMFFNGTPPSKQELTTFIESLGENAGIVQQYIFHYARQVMKK